GLRVDVGHPARRTVGAAVRRVRGGERVSGQDCATGCGRPVRDTLVLCEACLGSLRTSLGDVTWLDEQLETVLAKQTALAEHNGGRSAEEPLPLSPPAAKARSELRVALVGWVRDL